MFVEGVRQHGRDYAKIWDFMGRSKDLASVRSKASNIIKAIRKNPCVDYADILPILDPHWGQWAGQENHLQ